MPKGKCAKGTRLEISKNSGGETRNYNGTVLGWKVSGSKILDRSIKYLNPIWFNCAHGARIKLILIKKYLKVFESISP